MFDSSILTDVASEGQIGESINKEGVQLAKAKRKITRPAYLRDYAWNYNANEEELTWA